MKQLKYVETTGRGHASLQSGLDFGLDPIEPFLAQSHFRAIMCIFKTAAGVKGYTVCGQEAEEAQVSLWRLDLGPP